MMGNPDWSAFLNGQEYSAEQLSGIFLKNLVKEIEDSNGVQISNAVITVPAYFNERQREATIRAGKQAGLRVLKIINEPTAAIIAYGLTSGKDKNVMVYDLGGGTFDVTIAHVSGTAIDVLATNGNHQLGGKDWDEALLNDLKDRFFDEHGIYLEDHPDVLKELQVKCEEAKKRLSSVSSTQISVQCEGMVGKYVVTREDFDDKTYSLLYETMLLIKSCFDELSESGGKPFGWSDIDEVVLVGGSTRMPQVKKMIVDEYGKQPITRDINVDTIVATGAAMQAELCINNTLSLTVASKPVANGTGTARPQMMSLVIKNSDIKDITAHSLGMLALASNEKDYVNSIIIKKNSKVNEAFSRNYTIAGDKLEVYVLQGESKDPYDCEVIGAYSITGMNVDSKENIRVDFLYNSNGVVEVNAYLKDGLPLPIRKETTNETVGEIIARLERERKEAEEEAKRRSQVEIMLMIDTSGSMSDNRITEARRAAKDFVREFELDKVRISLISFANSCTQKCTWENDERTLNRAIDSMKIGEVGNGTSATPIESNYRQFSQDHPKVIVILTDGYWNNKTSEEAAADRAKKDGVIIYGIGIGEADEAFLSRISSGKGKKVDLSQLTSAFKEVASSIATEVAGNSLR